jgi:hypothetical protein
MLGADLDIFVNMARETLSGNKGSSLVWLLRRSEILRAGQFRDPLVHGARYGDAVPF